MKRRVFIDFSKTKEMDEVDYNLKMAVRDAVCATLLHQHFPFDARVSVTFTDNEYIKSLNKEYRDKDSATDVLSFPLYEDGDFELAECIEGASLGDIVLSLERAKEQAKEIGNSFLKEVAFLTIHSTLHLLGFDHERGKDDEEAQCAAQREIIKALEF